MNTHFLLAILFFGSGAATAGGAVVADDLIVGTWKCGPTTMHGPNFDLVITTSTTNRSDHTFVSTTTSVITPRGGAAITNIDTGHGTWNLDGDVISSTFLAAKFVSSSDPTISKELGQQIQEAQLKQKSTYKSRILEIRDNVSRSVPVESMYKEAVVESICRRI